MQSLRHRWLAILLLASGVLGACRREGPGEVDVPAGLRTQAVATSLPEGASVVVSGYDVEAFWTRLQGSQLYKDLKAIQGVREAFAPLAESQRQFEAETGLPLDETTLMTLFGQKFDIGFYGELPKNRADLLFVAEVEDEERAGELLESLERKVAADKGAAFSDVEVSGVQARVARDREGDQVLFYVLDGNRLTMATTQGRLGNALDLASGGASVKPMTSVEPYLEALRKLPDAAIAVYVDQRALQEAAARAAADTTGATEGDERLRAATSALEGTRVASSVTVGVYWTESGIRTDVYTRFPEGPRPPLATMLTQSPGPIQSLAYQPVGALLYVAVNSIEAQTVYQALYGYAVNATRIQMGVAGTPDSLRADSLVAANLRDFEQQTGINVQNDIVSWVGREAALTVAGVDKSGFFPLPEVSFTIATKDAGRARAFLTRMESELAEMARVRASIPLTWQSAEHQGQTIRFAPTPLGEGLSLSYAVDDQFVLVASSRSLLQRMIDARAGQAQALPSNPNFAAMTEFYPEQANLLGFVNIEQILTQVQDLMQTYGPMAGGAAASDTTSTPHQVLAALKNAPRMGFFTEADEDGVFAHVLLEVR
jgi:hypothetical protein